MTLEQFKAMVKELLGEALSGKEDAWGQIDKGLEDTVNASISGVIENKDKILSEKKALAEKTKTLEDQMAGFVEQGITLESWGELKKKAGEAEEAMKAGGDKTADMQKLQKESYEQGKKSMEQELSPRIKDYDTKIKELTDSQNAMRERHIQALKDAELSRVLNKLNVETDPFWLSGLGHSAKIEYVEAADKVDIELPSPHDPAQMIPLSDWAKLFPVSDEGKRRIRVQSSGSGAGGSGSKGTKIQPLEDAIGSLFRKQQ